MKSLGEELKKLMPSLTYRSEISRHICKGCGNEVVVFQMTHTFGPKKGELFTKDSGCVCWELGEAKDAKQAQRKMQIRQITEKFNTVNPDLEKATFSTYEPTNQNTANALRIAMDYAQSFSFDDPKSIIFAGSYGLGKSHLSRSICGYLEEKGFISLFVSVPKLLTIIKSTYNKTSDFTEAELLDRLSKVDFLALDDIGAEKVRKEEEGDSWATEKLFEIIDGRSGRHTLYTTNLTSSELRKKVGERNFSRMMVNPILVSFKGDDYRLKDLNF